MSKHPFMRVWTDDYLAATTHLTTVEHGAYWLLLLASWRSPSKTLPDDDILLARYARMRIDRWLKIAPIIREFFDTEDGYVSMSAALKSGSNLLMQR